MNSQQESVIRIAVILGTSRPGSFTAKALSLVTDELNGRDGIAVDFIDPAALDLPFPGGDDTSGDAAALQEIVSNATGIVFSSPEYHGTYSAMAKLLIENLGFPSVLAGKPIALVGVAAGQIGAIKALEHLRSILSHVGAIVLPGPVSVAGVHLVFDENGKCSDEETEKRIRGAAANLIDYIRTRICPEIALEALVREEKSKQAA